MGWTDAELDAWVAEQKRSERRAKRAEAWDRLKVPVLAAMIALGFWGALLGTYGLVPPFVGGLLAIAGMCLPVVAGLVVWFAGWADGGGRGG